MIRALVLARALAIGGCTTSALHAASGALIGRTLLEVEADLGIPSRIDTRDGQAIAEWDHQDEPVGGSLPIGDLMLLPVAWPISLVNTGNVSVAVAHSCHVIAFLSAGRVVRVAVTGNTAGITGTGAGCRAIFGTLMP